MKSILIALVLAAAPGLAAAQEGDLLDASRELRAATRTAASDGDWEAARRTNTAALALQPGHPGLLNNALVIAGLAQDEAAQFAALEAIAAAGLTFDVGEFEGGPALRSADPQRLALIQAALARNASPAGQARRIAAPPLRDALIEALDVDSETERLYLGGVVSRRIYRVDPVAPERAEILAGEAEPIGSIFGLAVDRRRGRLYAAEGVVDGVTPLGEGEAPGTALLELDLETGAILERHTIEGAQRIGDVFVRDSIVYATDAEGGRIYRLTPGQALQVYAQDARFAALQGVVSTRGAVYVLDYALGIWRIDPVDRRARLAAAAQGVSLIGLDGMAVDRAGRVFVVRNGAQPAGLFELEFNTIGAVTALTPVLVGDDRLGEPVTVRLTDGRAFLIADAQWRFFEGEQADPSQRTDPVIVSVPLD